MVNKGSTQRGTERNGRERVGISFPLSLSLLRPCATITTRKKMEKRNRGERPHKRIPGRGEKATKKKKKGIRKRK